MSQLTIEPTISGLLEVSLAAEELGRDFYVAMIEAFAHEPTAVALWTSMLLDEEKHILALQRLRDSMPPEQGATPVSPLTLGQALTIRRVVSKVRLTTIENLDDAYELAHEFEFSEINRIFLFCTAKLIPAADKQSVLVHHIADHQKKLLDFGTTLTNKRDRRSIAANKTAAKFSDLLRAT